MKTIMQRTAYDDFMNLLALFSNAKKVWENTKVKIFKLQFVPYRVNLHTIDHKPLAKKMELSDDFIRHYFPIGQQVISEPVSVISSEYDPQRRKGIVRFKIIKNYKVSTKNLVSNIRESYGDATKKKWEGEWAANTWMGGDMYYTNQLKYAILPSFEKIRKVGDGLWEATFVPYEQAHTVMKYVPLNKTEQKYGMNILKHLLPEKNGWFGHKFNQGVGHVHTSDSSLKNNLIKSKLFNGNNQNFTYNSRKYFKANQNVYGLKFKSRQ